MPNYIKPADILEGAVNAGATKAKLPLLDMILRGLYSGFILGVSASMASQATTQTGVALTGALLFPCGFMLIVYYGFELVTGNMLLLPIACMARKATVWNMVKNIVVVWCCNLLGTSLYLAFFYGSFTEFGYIPEGGALGKTVIATGIAKTQTYVKAGFAGWAACFFKAILCNFLVSFAALGSLCSTSTTGKLVACWLPVVMFASLGYEHVVVNMFIIPASMTFGSGVTWGEWWGWNLVPATLGNLFGAAVMVSIPMWVTWGHEYRKKEKAQAKLEDKLDEATASPLTPYPEPNESFPQYPSYPELPLFPLVPGDAAPAVTPAADPTAERPMRIEYV